MVFQEVVGRRVTNGQRIEVLKSFKRQAQSHIPSQGQGIKEQSKQ